MRADVSFIGILERVNKDNRGWEIIKNKSKTKFPRLEGRVFLNIKGLLSVWHNK